MFCPCPPALLGLCTVAEWGGLLEEDSAGQWSRAALQHVCQLEFNNESSQALQRGCYEALLSVLEELPPSAKRAFCYYVTAQHRLPASPPAGHIRVQVDNRNKRPADLPTAKTCVNTLYLANYPSREVLRDKLLKALELGLEDLGRD